MSERQVVFKLTTVADPALKSKLSEFSSAIKATYADIVKAEKAVTDSVLIEVKRQNEVQAKAIRDRDSAKQKAQDADLKRVEQAAAKERELQERASAKNAAAIETLRGKHKAASREAAMGYAELGESVMKVTRGVVALGLVGEKDLKKVADTLLLVQGAFDIVGGSVQTFFKIQKAIEATTTASKSLAAAQALTNATMSAGSAVSGAAGAAASRTGSGALGGAVAGAAGGVASRTGVAALAGAGPIAAMVAAVAGAGFGLVSAFNFVKDAFKSGVGGGAKAGSYTDAVGSSWLNPFSYGGFSGVDITGISKARSDSAAAQRRTDRMQRSSGIAAEQRANRENLAGELASSLGGLSAQQSARSDAKLESEMRSLSYREKSLRITAEIAAEEGAIAVNRKKAAEIGEKSEAMRAHYLVEAQNGEQRILELIRKRGEAEAAISRDKLAKAQKTFDVSKADLEQVKAAQAESKAALLSAEERFGTMAPEDQKALKDIVAKAQKGKDLSRDEVLKIQGTGLAGVDEIAGEQARRLAQKGGFEKIAAEDRRRAAELEESRRKLSMNVSDNRSIVINLNYDIEAQARKVAEEIEKATAKGDAELTAKVKDLYKQVEELRRQVINGAGGRN